ncbi:TetR/AcrR family transcriptional regulator [Nannocystis punicea]|uniref:Helix-turn-helix domain containing protein n=1 Tax=Nannocystis punicea TaxID=2995304 RepID=A0ABY7H122_9BACT|nr:TetR/AcrR family transcriptional regulator [Nannocystis poenicansa]WAS92951.1 helix-turn-helix domain containing protein [Nannocystis poenicansa]
MTTSRDDRDRERRRAIIDAALACFLQFGYAKTSLEDIARRANLSRPLLYQKFPNKDAILAAVHESVFAALYPRVDEALAGRGGKRAKLAQVCELAVLGPWKLLEGAPMAKEFHAACATLAPAVAEKHARKLLSVVQQILGDRLAAEVFLLAVDGLTSDTPSLVVLRKRLGALVDRFAR